MATEWMRDDSFVWATVAIVNDPSRILEISWEERSDLDDAMKIEM